MRQSDLGSMLLATVRYSLRMRGGYTAEYAAKLVRRHFNACDDYDQRQIVTEIEIAVACPERDIVPKSDLDQWSALVEEIRPPKAPFTVKYACGKCHVDGVKLWRGIHGCEFKGGYELLCAACLAPDQVVDDDGKTPWSTKDASGKVHDMGKTDQVANGLPAVPVGDTFWGYTSVPTADVRWWKALPTYKDRAPRTAKDRSSG